MKITKDVKYIGVNDHEIDLFEGQYIVPNGMAYNSYVIIDDKVAVMDTVDARFSKQWLANLKKALKGRAVDYLVIQHVEPDHSSSIVAFAEAYPEATIVSNAKAFTLIDNFYGEQLALKRVTVAEGETLTLGRHSLAFVFAPMVHWPEVMVSYDATDKILFSADGFGKFGALDVEEEWACEARRYYFGIVGKYGVPVQQLLKKAAGLDIAIICPLHGPVLTENLGYYLDLYNTWSGYGVESEGVCICYTSVYGHTAAAVELLACELEKRGCKVAVNDLARCDMAEALEDAFRYGKLVLATTTYNASIFPFMHDFVTRLVEHGYQNRVVGLIENGSWAPQAANVIRNMMSNCKKLTFTDTTVTIHSALKPENRAQILQLADELTK